jgi:hypothetical protein
MQRTPADPPNTQNNAPHNKIAPQGVEMTRRELKNPAAPWKSHHKRSILHFLHRRKYSETLEFTNKSKTKKTSQSTTPDRNISKNILTDQQFKPVYIIY